MDPLKSGALLVAAWAVAACAAPAAIDESTPALRFAAPVLPAALAPAGQPAPAPETIAETLPPGYHCHWLSPGRKYCHGGSD